MKPERKACRSDKYQYILNEISCHYINELSDDRDNHAQYISDEDYETIEKIFCWDSNLGEEFHRFLKEVLTLHQQTVYALFAQGMTQMEVGRVVGSNQASAHKSMFGNLFKLKGKKVRYGGVGKKIIVSIKQDEKINTLMCNIYSELEEHWNVHLPFYHNIIAAYGGYFQFEQFMKEMILALKQVSEKV